LELTPENLTWIRIAIFVAFGLPALPLLLTWRAFIQGRPGRLTTMAIVILSVSYLWVLAVLAGAPLVAPPHYTAARSTIIDVNNVATLVAIVLVVIGRAFRRKLFLAGFGVLILWGYIGFLEAIV
jgi:hypothetical protein